VRARIATVSLAGCFGCHMSFLDLDERVLALMEEVELVLSPLVDAKGFDGPVDVGIVEGGCANEHHVRVLRDFRAHCKALVSIGECAITGGVPSMRNGIPLAECLDEAYRVGHTVDDAGRIPSDDVLPRLLDRVYPCHEFVKIDYFLRGCPPSADAIWRALHDILGGRAPALPYALTKFD
jgi:NAD-reducing hydrogenase small subunit